MPKDDPLRDGPVILNPLGEDSSVMRTVSLPSMLDVLARNASYRNTDVKLYELAKVYRNVGETLPDERLILTLGAYGKTDFYAMKGCIETILADLRIPNVSFTAESGRGAYHPGRCAIIRSGETELGVMGQLHPKTAEAYGLDETYAAELDFTAMLACRGREETYQPLPKYPEITRDIAVVCDDEIPVASLMDCITRSGGKLLCGLKLFDIYKGSHIPEGKKSTAFSLCLRAEDQTLTDDMADGVVKKVLAQLEKELGAVIR